MHFSAFIPTVTAKDCCVGTNDGRSYSYDSNCIVQVCIGLSTHDVNTHSIYFEKFLFIYTVYGFVNTTYDVTEGGRLDTFFQLNVERETTHPTLNNISGTISAVAGGTASE